MPKLQRDQVFQAWIQEQGAVEPATTFVLDRDGTANATMVGLEGAEAVVVTAEPRGGSRRRPRPDAPGHPVPGADRRAVHSAAHG